MTSQNETAENVMRSLEKEEESEMALHPSKHVYHLCIVNLVIGTLYVSKGNLEFGLQRVMKSLEPFDKKVRLRCLYVVYALTAVIAWHGHLVLCEASASFCFRNSFKTYGSSQR